MKQRNQNGAVDQLGLEFEGRRRARRRVPDTSHAAGEKAAHRTAKIRSLITAFIAVRGPHTADEIAEATATTEYERGDVRRLMEFRRRCSDLHTRFFEIRDSGQRRANSAGNPMIVWELGDARG